MTCRTAVTRSAEIVMFSTECIKISAHQSTRNMSINPDIDIRHGILMLLHSCTVCFICTCITHRQSRIDWFPARRRQMTFRTAVTRRAEIDMFSTECIKISAHQSTIYMSINPDIDIRHSILMLLHTQYVLFAQVAHKCI